MRVSQGSPPYLAQSVLACSLCANVVETLAIGAQGFFLKQITGDRGSGAVLGDFKAEAAGIGPALFWATTIGKQNVSFITKWFHEFHAESRLEGDHVFVSFALDW